MAKAQRMTITDDALSYARAVRRGPSTWFDRLPAEVQAELEDLKRRFVAGELGDLTRQSLSRGLEHSLRSRDMLNVRSQEVSRWLAR